jgi:hypothetical protein
MNTFVTTLAMVSALVVLAIGNEQLLRWTEVTPGVNWIYLPAGLRMCYALVLPLQGTVAIFMGVRDPTLSGLLIVLGACVTAAGPLLARVVATHRLGLRPNLENLTGRMLWVMAAVFGLFSSTLHQAYYAWLGREPAWLSMWLGDTVGCLLCLYGLKTAMSLWQRHSQH